MQWDDRLTTLGINLKANEHGKWSATTARYQDEMEAQGQHHIWFTVLDENNKPKSNVRVFVDWIGRDKDDPPTVRMTDADGRANVDIYANLDITKKNGPYFAYVEGEDKSDVIAGMGLPEHHHVNYMLTFAPRLDVPVPQPAPTPPTLTTPPLTPPPLPQSIEESILQKAKAVEWMPVNNGSALWNFAKANGLQDQQTDEIAVTINGQEYLLQVFNLGIVYAKMGDWGNIKVIKK
ncbi:MAG: hypothetical protein EYC68_14700 [Chloroflexota bacterium]|nr:MAG: hypothetical protein EYC68_14700 [Chloroflexota bacterium]